MMAKGMSKKRIMLKRKSKMKNGMISKRKGEIKEEEKNEWNYKPSARLTRGNRSYKKLIT